MPTQEYLLALGENRWFFADADYALVYLLMVVDETYQSLIDRPTARGLVITSGKLGQHWLDRLENLDLPEELKIEARAIAAEWKALSKRRDNLAHAWGYTAENRDVQLGGYSHEFPKGAEPVHTKMEWSLVKVQEMTEDCRRISGRITDWRKEFERRKNEDTLETANSLPRRDP